MPAERQARILGDMDEERAADILEWMSPDEAADVLGDLPEEKAEELLGLDGRRRAGRRCGVACPTKTTLPAV